MVLEEENEIRAKSSVLTVARVIWGDKERCCLRQWEDGRNNRTRKPARMAAWPGYRRPPATSVGCLAVLSPLRLLRGHQQQQEENQALMSTKFVPLYLQVPI